MMMRSNKSVCGSKDMKTGFTARRRVLLSAIGVWLIFCLIPATANSCTGFFLALEDQPVLGTNFDWHFGSGMVVINKRNVFKQGMPVSADDPVDPPTWISRYGSVTFNQYGRETPMGGMNEAGLVVHQMMLRQSVFPTPDRRKPVKNLQWIQFQLDNFASVEEVVHTNQSIRIQEEEVPGLHYLVADSSGDCASMEWINGKLVLHRGETMPYKVLANNTYIDSLRYLKRHNGFGGTLEFEQSPTMSLDRFATAVKMVTTYPGRTTMPLTEYAFDILRNVANETTRWQIVYDMKQLRVYFKTASNNQVRVIDMSQFDLSCKSPVKILDLDNMLSGDVSDRFVDYTWQANRKYISTAFKSTWFAKDIPQDYIHQRSLYPDTNSCCDK